MFQSMTVKKTFVLAGMYEVANTSLSLECLWQFNKNKGILGPKPLPLVKSFVV